MTEPVLFLSEFSFKWIIVLSIGGVGLTILLLIGTMLKEAASKKIW